ncbi:MAG: trypsin-like peptidase domain-containing protein [Pirellulales bacterium]
MMCSVCENDRCSLGRGIHMRNPSTTASLGSQGDEAMDLRRSSFAIPFRWNERLCFPLPLCCALALCFAFTIVASPVFAQSRVVDAPRANSASQPGARGGVRGMVRESRGGRGESAAPRAVPAPETARPTPASNRSPMSAEANSASGIDAQVAARSEEQDASTGSLEVSAPAVFAGGVPTGIAELKAMQTHLRKISERLLAATVGIRVGSAYGSGVIVSPEGMVLTAAHVAQGANVPCDVILPDGRSVRAKTLGLNRNIDAALVQIVEPGPWPVAAINEGTAPKAGQWCMATGHPGGYERGRKPVLRLGRILETSNAVMVTDCTLVGGDSGGPLFDGEGRVIGIHSRIGGMLTANLHVPVAGFRESWERLERGESWGHLPGQAPFLGVRGAPEGDVAKISEVFPETPAARAGLKAGDVVISFGGKRVGDFTSLTELVGQTEPGARVPLVVRRGDEMLELELVVGKR